MKPEQGGLVSPEDRQRQAAAAIARQKVIEAYKADRSNYAEAEPTSSAQSTMANGPQAKREDWQKYHSAWQEYYQKYYSSYYTQAAQQYFEKEKLKMERQFAEKKPELNSALDITSTQDDHMQQKIQNNIRRKASEHAQRFRKSRHFIPIAIGLAVVLFATLLQYNQIIFANVAAYIAPGGGSVQEIEAIDPTITSEVGPDPKLIIPKLNVSVPINFNYNNDQKSMSNAMLNGIAHFSVPGANALPGQIGNFVVSGHSAGNVYWQSDYKFIFSGLDRLEDGDLIYVNYDSVRYTYSVNSKRTVLPSNVNALTDIAKENSGKPVLTMITCTPLGTSQFRLLVAAQQISPGSDGATSAAPSQPEEEENEVLMPANEDPPFQAFWKWLTGQN